MKYTNIGNYSSLIDYVNYKISLLDLKEHTFSYLYELMFLDKENIMFEKSEGYKIKKYTYGDIKNNIETKAYNISKILKNATHKVVGIYLDNDNRFIETYWAIIRSGNNPLLLNTRLCDDILNEAINSLDVIAVISNGKAFNVPSIDILDIEKEVEAYKGDVYGEEMYIMSTGTSSKIKLCAYNASQLFNVLKQSYDIIMKNKKMKVHYNGELKLLAFLPFYHIFGFVAVYLWFSFYARTFVLLKDNAPKTIQNTIRRHQVTHIFAVPLFWEKTYQAVLKEIRNKGEKTYQKFLKGMQIASKPVVGKLITKYAFKEIRDGLFGDSIAFMITGGSMIKNEVLEFFNKIGYHLVNGYGMSEIGITSVELSMDKKYILSGSIGEPLSGINYEINEDNELVIKGNTLADYIIENGKKIKLNGIYNSHDIASKIKEHYYLLGRKDDVLIAPNGENINPYEIERKMNLSSINDTCLIYSSSLDVPVLLVGVDKLTPKEKVLEIKKELMNIITSNNLNTLIGKIVFINGSLIQGEEFKLNRKRLLKDYLLNSLSLYDFDKKEDEEDDELMKKVKGLFAVSLNIDVKVISSDLDFFTDLGGTSLDFYIVQEAINEEFHISLFKDDKPISTPKDIVELIKNNL